MEYVKYTLTMQRIGICVFLMCIFVMNIDTQNTQCTGGDANVPCSLDTGPVSMYTKYRDYILPRTDPGEVGHVTTLHLVPEKTHTMVTKAKNPPIFEIPNFLSPTECDHIISVARAKGLEPAKMIGGASNYIKTEGGVHTRKNDVRFIGTGHDEQLRLIRNRVSTLTQMPLDLLEDSEAFQVGHYTVGGHYHSHYDSSESALPCCHNTPQPRNVNTCIVCRYMTVLIYLNDVEKGGETAFPLADTSKVKITDRHYNLSGHCHEAPVVVRPQKGKAVMWYNNYRDPETGWLGSVDPNSLHGGCPVLKGEKWITNVWISASHYEERYEDSVFTSN